MQPHTSSRAGSAGQGCSTTTEGCFRGDVNAAEAQSLWDALARARVDCAPGVLAAAEDAVFRWYLPLARGLAAGRSATASDPIAMQQAAELGLAQAVLSWHQLHCREFERFAHTVITERLQRYSAEPGTRGAVRTPEPVPLFPEHDDDVMSAGTQPESSS